MQNNIPYPGNNFLYIKNLQPYHASSWDEQGYTPLGFLMETTNRDALIVLRMIQARLVKNGHCPMMAPAVLGMQEKVFGSHDWACIIGEWVKDAQLTREEFGAFERFAFYMGADIVTLALIRTYGKMDDYDLIQFRNMAKALKNKK